MSSSCFARRRRLRGERAGLFGCSRRELFSAAEPDPTPSSASRTRPSSAALLPPQPDEERGTPRGLNRHAPPGAGARLAMAKAPALPAVRAAAQAAAAAHRRDRPGRCRGARGRAREAEHQEGLEALGARARDPLLRPDDARGAGHARQGGGALQQGGAARPDRPEHPVGRRRVRLPEPRPGRGRAAPRDRRQGRLRRDGVPVRPEPARREGARRRGRRSRSAPTRSTW